MVQPQPTCDARLLKLPYCSWEWDLASGKLSIHACAYADACAQTETHCDSETGGGWLALMPPERAAALETEVREQLLTQNDFHVRLQIPANGETHYFILHGIVADRAADRTPLRIVGISRKESYTERADEAQEFLNSRDLEERRQMENVLINAQRFASITQISGSVAHDLNNLLSPIRMSVELLKRKLKDPSVDRYVEIIEESTSRARSVVQQLLALARNSETGHPESINLNHVLRELEKMVQTTFPERIVLLFEYADDLPRVKMDPDQLHQAILNILINARDAIEGPGQLHVSSTVRNVHVDVKLGERCIAAGSYVTVSIRDSGCGMSPEVQERIFDPFFTTKEKDKGTGLGLASVYGIIAAVGGFIDVQSEIGKGSTFHLCLPTTAAISEPDIPNR